MVKQESEKQIFGEKVLDFWCILIIPNVFAGTNIVSYYITKWIIPCFMKYMHKGYFLAKTQSAVVI